ncbi:DUF2982 domain-containing protein [Psychrosphaera ytuae]|uniref:DUF2982 domain-containing protein n=1 Tax=Psychrosphaera ytuae TaxID=2820710 RepID=A0A975DB57_9GAMM|nr:DUF2982 domain-containing protein [Psychrosphaera ytuae]QTH63708.1 DUF2982 domain-containing protein [Psychrosphaera ytuae]
MQRFSSNKQVNAKVVAQFAAALGALGLFVSLSSIPGQSLIATVSFVAAIALVLFALALNSEPADVLVMAEQKITFYHKRGSVSFDIDNIQRCDLVTINQMSGRQSTGYIGFRLKSPVDLIQTIPLRLASRLLIEQKDLQLVAGKEQCASGACNLDGIIDKLEWKSPTGEIFNGVVGMYANRTEVLRDALGYDFYISNQSFDDKPEIVIHSIKKFLTKNRV